VAEIAVAGLHKSYRTRLARVNAVEDISFVVPDGQLLVLLGPSGCGKSTTLRCLAGLEEPEGGSIRFGPTVVYDKDARVDVAAHRRDVGLVFQSFALWPHMSARANIEFPLRSRRVPVARRRLLVDDVGRLVDLAPDLLAKRPGQLSGGQQQRVALARALVAQPAVMLFDEPLSNLDANLREQLRIDLRALHQELRFTGVYVTHDLVEALALGDQIAVMLDGRIAQLGTPRDVFRHPVTADVAGFLGFRRLCRLVADGADWRAAEGDVGGFLPSTAAAPPTLDLLVRPNDIVARRPGNSERRDGHVSLAGGTIRVSAFQGDQIDLVVDFRSGSSIRLRASDQGDLGPVGSAVTVEAPRSSVLFYDIEGKIWAPEKDEQLAQHVGR
jgi:iron(III) transport system ATP-binding protein